MTSNLLQSSVVFDMMSDIFRLGIIILQNSNGPVPLNLIDNLHGSSCWNHLLLPIVTFAIGSVKYSIS